LPGQGETTRYREVHLARFAVRGHNAADATGAQGLLEGKKAVDLTLDPRDPMHLVVLSSSVADIDDEGVVTSSRAPLRGVTIGDIAAAPFSWVGSPTLAVAEALRRPDRTMPVAAWKIPQRQTMDRSHSSVPKRVPRLPIPIRTSGGWKRRAAGACST
jgi:hypothetical protein